MRFVIRICVWVGFAILCSDGLFFDGFFVLYFDKFLSNLEGEFARIDYDILKPHQFFR